MLHSGSVRGDNHAPPVVGVGLPEAAAAVGLLAGYASAPLGAAAAVGLTLLMAAALVMRLRIRDGARFLLGDTAIGSLAAATAVMLMI